MTIEDIRNRATIPVWPDAGQLLGVGKNAVYAGIARGEIPSLRVGKRILVPVAPLLRMLGIDDDAPATMPGASDGTQQ